MLPSPVSPLCSEYRINWSMASAMGSFTLDDLASTTTIGKPFTNNTRSGIIWWSVPVTFTLNCEMAVNTLFSMFSKSMNRTVGLNSPVCSLVETVVFSNK